MQGLQEMLKFFFQTFKLSKRLFPYLNSHVDFLFFFLLFFTFLGANKDAIALEMAENQPQRMRRIMRRNQVIQKIKEQQDLMDSLQDQLENYMHRSFPSLG